MTEKQATREEKPTNEADGAGAKGQNGAKTVVDQAMKLVSDHPKASLVVGAGVSFLVGLELLGAALVGGAVALAGGARRQPPAPPAQ